MLWILLLFLITLIMLVILQRRANARALFKVIPEHHIIFDLETTGLNPDKNEIIEIGAIRIHRDSNHHDTFQVLVHPRKKIPAKITQLTGITQTMVDEEGVALNEAISEFLEFIGDLRLVSYNADFDMAFLKNAIRITKGEEFELINKVSCALRMARRAWPGLRSYKLSDLATMGNLSAEGTHRALGDCNRTAYIYGAAAMELKSPA